MTTEVLIDQPPRMAEIGNKLKQLATQANDAHLRIDQAARKNLFDALEAGQALLQAKKLCLGEWLVWLRHNFDASVRTAQRYMAFATECRQIGGLDATRVSRLTPQELGRIWTKLLRETSQRKKQKAAAGKPAAAPKRLRAPSEMPAANAVIAESGGARTIGVGEANTDGDADPLAEQEAYGGPETADPLLRLAALFEKLIDGFREVMNGDDEHDGPYADWMLTDIEPHYADLREYLDIRKEWRSKRG